LIIAQSIKEGIIEKKTNNTNNEIIELYQFENKFTFNQFFILSLFIFLSFN
jgi:hypothetical protein